jgi:hypothetical protein
VTRLTQIRHQFVEFIPEELASGVLYVSVPYATAAHKCCCGCGREVATPLTPTDWSVTYDGESVSLDPSIGNWSFPCKSHYWIRHDRVQWAGRWTASQVESGRQRDRARKLSYHDAQPQDPEMTVEPGTPAAPGIGRLRRVLAKLRRP